MPVPKRLLVDRPDLALVAEYLLGSQMVGEQPFEHVPPFRERPVEQRLAVGVEAVEHARHQRNRFPGRSHLCLRRNRRSTVWNGSGRPSAPMATTSPSRITSRSVAARRASTISGRAWVTSSSRRDQIRQTFPTR